MSQLSDPYARARHTKRDECNTPTCALVAQSAQDRARATFPPSRARVGLALSDSDSEATGSAQLELTVTDNGYQLERTCPH